MSKECKKPTIIGHNIDGTPITQVDLRRRVKAASQRVKSGDYLTQEKIENEISNW